MLVSGGLSLAVNHLDIFNGEWNLIGRRILWFPWQPPNTGVATMPEGPVAHTHLLHFSLPAFLGSRVQFPSGTQSCVTAGDTDPWQCQFMGLLGHCSLWCPRLRQSHCLQTWGLEPFCSEGTWGLKWVHEACGWWTVRCWILKRSQVITRGVGELRTYQTKIKYCNWLLSCIEDLCWINL